MQCPKCNGRGYQLFPSIGLFSGEVEMVKEPCEACGGTGEVEEKCEACRGTGVVERTIHDTGFADADCECVCAECGGTGRA